MGRFVSRFACAAALLTTSGMAHAGTSTATGAASMNVINQCSVTGANVNLGTFTTNNTWADVGAQLGYLSGAQFTYSTQGFDYANFGSVTCEAGTPYTLSITGTSSGFASGGLKLTINGKTAAAWIYLKQIGEVTLPDYGNFPGLGAIVSNTSVSGTGTGTPQVLKGNLAFDFYFNSGDAALTDKLATAGTYSDTLTYTLNF